MKNIKKLLRNTFGQENYRQYSLWNIEITPYKIRGEGLLELNNEACGYFYVLANDTIIPSYFDSEDDFRNAFEKDYADEYWEDMDFENNIRYYRKSEVTIGINKSYSFLFDIQ